MKRIYVLVLFLIVSAIFVIAIFLKWRNKRKIRDFKLVKKDGVGEILEDLTLEQKIGQVVLTRIDEAELTPLRQKASQGQVGKEIEMVRNAEIAGFVFLGKNIRNPEQVKSLTSEIQAAATVSVTKELPILISVDQEGGSVTRINFEDSEITPQWQIESVEQAFEIGKKRGAELKNLGIDVNFSPVVEVLRNPNSYLGQSGRYFIGDEQKVVQLSEAMIKGMNENGVVAVVKHFPGGLERTALNPYDVLPSVDIKKEDLEEDLLTFRELIKLPGLVLALW